MDQREASKQNWNSPHNTIEQINSGSLQRIADATEKMAANHIQLQNDRDMYKRWYENERSENGKLTRRLTAFKGVITKLKKQIVDAKSRSVK